jgi:hypothetical protein
MICNNYISVSITVIVPKGRLPAECTLLNLASIFNNTGWNLLYLEGLKCSINSPAARRDAKFRSMDASLMWKYKSEALT